MIPFNAHKVCRGTLLAYTTQVDNSDPKAAPVKPPETEYYMVLKKLSKTEYRVFDLKNKTKRIVWVGLDYPKLSPLTWQMQLPTHKLLTPK